jgi:lysophospholipase L1-like esterase
MNVIIRLLLCAAILLVVPVSMLHAQQQIRIACLGASITHGSLLENPARESFPAQLQTALGELYVVTNYGVPGATLLKRGDLPYHKTKEYQQALQHNPNLVIIDLGGNDSKLINRIYMDTYEADYREMIAAFRALPSKPRIILLLPVPSFVTDSAGIWDPVIVSRIIPRVRNVAFTENVELLDMHSILIDKPDLFPDKIHPNLEGTTLMSKKIAAVIRQERDAGFDLPARMKVGGKTGSYHGYECVEFSWKGRDCKVVKPKLANIEHRWIWRARFWGHEPQTEIALLELGFHVVYCDVAELLGNKEAVGAWNTFYEMLTNGGLHKKAVMEGMSRGAVYVYNWSAENPTRVACVYVDNPLLDLRWWPARQYRENTTDKAEWEAFKKDYGFSTDAEALTARVGPIDKVPQIVQGNYPMLHVCGDADEAVPIETNTLLFAEKVKSLNGDITVLIKSGFKHHPHSLPNPTPIVDFILASVVGK